MHDQKAGLIWRDGDVPVSTRFDDPYYSLEDGLEETRHVFLAGNGLPARFADGFHIAELGFGTGLNFLATVAAWREAGANGHLRFASFEAFPLSADEMARALAPFDGLSDLADQLLSQWGAAQITIGSVDLTLIRGDARATLPQWRRRADAWFLDGFAPARNPELWEPALMQAVADHTNPGGTVATYSAAGDVRRALSDAGFDIARVPGFGRKRHMVTGTLR